MRIVAHRQTRGSTMADIRKTWLTRPIHAWAKKALPTLSKTDADALDAGEVWWEAELFSGDPDWDKLLDVATPELTDEERAFLEGPCEELCAMIDDWTINHADADLPPEVWDFLRRKKFFGMIIDKDHGGLGFSAYAHSEIVRYISTRSVAAAVTVMVPNSLGPGELLHMFGTEAQKDHWLPRLADGRELPAFGLTSSEAGSDAASMLDEGVIEMGDWQGEQVLGIRLNWAKRYITLAPVCSVLGLAFKLRDPDGHLGGGEDIGITCALVPTDLPGVETGRRHIPSATMCQNGPTTGQDVFVPLNNIIGGRDCAGHGWMMLMAALAAGRGISLPSMACAATALAAHSAGAYARIREQFKLPIGKFGGIQARLGPLAAESYAIDSARRLTCAGLDEGRSLSVISAIMKAHATFRMRGAVDDAMDIHSGKAVIDGPSNYLLPLHRAVPIGITVEGANIVTRNLIILGQGAIRAHPHLLDDMLALQEPDAAASLDRFDTAFWRHVGHALRTLGRATGRAWTGGRAAPAPRDAGAARPIYRQLSRWSAAFALTSEAALLTLGGGLKKAEMISARLGDVLSELYFVSAVVKRWEDDGRPDADAPLVHFIAETGFARIGERLDGVLANMPSRTTAALLRVLVRPAAGGRGPRDSLKAACSDLMLEPSETRARVVGRLFGGCERDGIRVLNEAFDRVVATAPLAAKLRKTGKSRDEALAAGLIGAAEKAELDDRDAAVRAAIAVDDFTPEQLAALFPGARHSDEPRTEA